MRKLAVIVLTVACLAAPVGAFCSTCCPDVDRSQKLGAPMPCCDEGCAPKLASGKSSPPALTVGRAPLDPPYFPLTSLSAGLSVSILSASSDPFESPSPPGSSGRPFSILRL